MTHPLPRLLVTAYRPVPAPYRRYGILGYAVVALPDIGLVLHNVAVRTLDSGGLGAVLPKIPVLRDGVHLQRETDEDFAWSGPDFVWRRAVTFDAAHEANIAFSAAVLNQIHAAYPGALPPPVTNEAA